MVAKVMFRDGVAVEEVVRIFLAGSLQSGDFDLTRLFFLKENGVWSHKDVPTIVPSLCVLMNPTRTYLALGRNGRVFGVPSGGSWFEERISDAGTGTGKYGYLTQIRAIGTHAYACGHRGQVYRRDSGGWIHVDAGLLESADATATVSLNAIDGSAEDAIYVVGDSGRVYFFDGSRWDDVSPQTNLNLLNVRVTARDEVYVCGRRGLVLRGDGSQWTVLQDAESEADVWDLQPYMGKLYLAAGETLSVYDGHDVVPVDTGLDPPLLDAYHLGSRNGILWSFGEEDLAFFDGAIWTRVIHPDNA